MCSVWEESYSRSKKDHQCKIDTLWTYKSCGAIDKLYFAYLSCDQKGPTLGTKLLMK